MYFYSNNKRCIPYKQTQYIKFDNLNITKPIVNKEKQINIGCFDGKWMIIYTVNYNDNNLLELFTNQNTAFLRTEDFVSNC